MTRPSLADAARAAAQGLCPACGAPGLFAGLIGFAPRCSRCGLDFGRFNVGDGPAAFLTLLVGAVVTVAAIAVELAVSPPFWVHLLLWVPLAAALVIVSLRVAKGLLLHLEFRNQAREGRLDQ